MKAQQIRERLEKGMRVDVVIRPAPNIIKRKPAVVVEVVRSAARVRVDGETEPRTVRFSDLEIPAPPPASRLRPASTALEQLPSKTAPAPAATSAPIAPRSSVDTWLEMGAELEADIETELSEFRQQKAALESERAELDRELDAVTNRYSELHKSLEMIRSIRKARA